MTGLHDREHFLWVGNYRNVLEGVTLEHYNIGSSVDFDPSDITKTENVSIDRCRSPDGRGRTYDVSTKLMLVSDPAQLVAEQIASGTNRHPGSIGGLDSGERSFGGTSDLGHDLWRV